MYLYIILRFQPKKIDITLNEGDKVEFTIEEGQKGPQAKDVVITEKAPVQHRSRGGYSRSF